MSYQVLARKWRPQNFQQMAGQEHVLKTLANALDQDRLHHAYLFSGTRGVGKTTIARIFAKSLNCEKGISSQPCGQCAACIEIVEGRFVDLIEIDAASRTKVEDMRELLDNVQYAPTRSRYKIYLIDEVHMLSNSSFNALLKTLEEPPPHIKFLLATTDPQKLPVTVLSRCLQFNLKNLSPERIVKHLSYILQQEQVGVEDAALWELAKAADGSMRDALSLTDQCIAFGNGAITTKEVLEMLGTIEKHVVLELLQLTAAGNAAGVLGKVSVMAEFSPDYAFILQAMAELLHRVAIEQRLPGAIDNSFGDQQQVSSLARQMSAEDAQLYYEIAVISRRDIALAPDARTGFEMALLRMLTFRPNLKPGQQQACTPSAAAESTPADQAGGESGADKQSSSAVQQPAPERAVIDQALISELAGQSELQSAEHPHSQFTGEANKALETPETVVNKAKQPFGQGTSVEDIKVPDTVHHHHGQPGKPQQSKDGDFGSAATRDHDASGQGANGLDANSQDANGKDANSHQANGHGSINHDFNDETTCAESRDNSPPDLSLLPLEAYGDVEWQADSLSEAVDLPGPFQPSEPLPKNLTEDSVQARQSAGPDTTEDAGTGEEDASTGEEDESSGEEDLNPEEEDEDLEDGELEAMMSVVQDDFDFSRLGTHGNTELNHEPRLLNQRWSEVIGKLKLSGMTFSLCQRLVLSEVLGERLEFIIDEDHFDFFNQLQQNRLTDALAEFTAKPVKVVVTAGTSAWLSPLQEFETRRAELQAAAEKEIHADQNVRDLIELFDASVVENSIRPVVSNDKSG